MIKLIIEPHLLKEFEVKKQRAQAILKQEVAKGCDSYVPADTTILAKSVQSSISTPNPYIEYSTPYAHYQYYTNTSKSTDVHPKACSQWFEKWKAADGKAIIEKVKKAVGL